MAAHAVYEFAMVEFRTRSLERAMSFYHEAFGWTPSPIPGQRFAFADPGKTPLVELLEVDAPIPTGVMPYLLTDAIDESLADVERLGGTVLLGRSEWGSIGWWANTVDPWGNEMALLQTVNPWAPSFRANPRHPIVWAELRAPDLAGAVRYYKQLAGWSFQIKPDVEDFAFRSAGRHPVGVGLVGGERADHLERLTMYVRVDSLREATDRIVAAGGQLSQYTKAAPETGRIRIAYDPDGNAIGLFEDSVDAS
ncbi:MAG: hypothetical protein EP329_16820 [Deltaproteobacteria bacterium]|nr:MAG: hypothetical protein EP329_16820 [Deltaproteobacteria bacterium]